MHDNHQFESQSPVKMDPLRTYDSEESSSEGSESLCGVRGEEIRSVYLLTSSQANLDLFPLRKEFALAVIKSFTKCNAKILHLCCCREKHQKAREHNHLALKLDRNRRWLSSKKFLLNEYGITVNYSTRHHNYYSAWQYVTKSDDMHVGSADHPDFKNSSESQTSPASRAKHSNKGSRKGKQCRDVDDEESDEEMEDTELPSTSRKRKRKRLSAFEVSQIIVEKKVKSLVELQALAYEQKRRGKLISQNSC